jgi:hypothetical protein
VVFQERSAQSPLEFNGAVLNENLSKLCRKSNRGKGQSEELRVTVRDIARFEDQAPAELKMCTRQKRARSPHSLI